MLSALNGTAVDWSSVFSPQQMEMCTSDLYARVVAVDSGIDGFNCSMEFTDIDMAARQAIKQFVDSQIVPLSSAIEH